MARTLTGALRKRIIRLLTPENFVLFKLLSTRERDLEDAASVARRNPDALDADLIGREVEMLAREIADFDMRARYRSFSK